MRKLNFFTSLSFIVLAAIQCQPREFPEPGNQPDLRPLSSIESTAINGGNEFAFDIFRQVIAAEPSGNLFISPFSIGMALAMTNNGSDEDLKKEFAKTLRLEGLNQNEVNQAYADIRSRLLAMDNKVKISIPNSVWYNSELTVKAAFREALTKYFQAEVKAANFKDPATLNLINSWVKSSTNGTIEKILDEIKPDHVMFLINAIYFKAAWKFPFDKSKTQNRIFYTQSGQEVSVPTMFTKDATYAYLNHEMVELVDLPYGNGQFRMTILMPPQGRTLSNLAENLNSGRFNSWLSAAHNVKYDLYLPKFSMEYEKKLNDILADMGMPSAFSENFGNLSNLFEQSGSFIIDEVKHKAFIDVNEEGTEAAAVTSVGIVVTSLPPSVRVNRSFLFLIREEHTKAIVFAGRVEKP